MSGTSQVQADLAGHESRQIRTLTLRAPLHKNTVGLLALGHNQGAAKAANYANVSVDNRARTRRSALPVVVNTG